MGPAAAFLAFSFPSSPLAPVDLLQTRSSNIRKIRQSDSTRSSNRELLLLFLFIPFFLYFPAYFDGENYSILIKVPQRHGRKRKSNNLESNSHF